MGKRWSAVLLILLSAWCGRIRADVFSLFPFQSGGSASGVDNALHSSELWSEEVEINGRRLDLQVALVNKDLNQAIRDLRGLYKNGSAAMNSNSLLFEVPMASGARRRYFLIELKGMIPTLQFSLILPAGFSLFPALYWILGIAGLFRADERMTRLRKENGIGRILRSAAGCTVCAFAALLGDTIFLLAGSQAGKEWPGTLMLALASVLACGTANSFRGVNRGLISEKGESV